MFNSPIASFLTSVRMLRSSNPSVNNFVCVFDDLGISQMGTMFCTDRRMIAEHVNKNLRGKAACSTPFGIIGNETGNLSHG
jgi:hypothetical protein